MIGYSDLYFRIEANRNPINWGIVCLYFFAENINFKKYYTNVDIDRLNVILLV